MTQFERRQSPRFPTDLPGLLGEDAVSCRIRNLSRAGALAVTSHPLADMSQVKVVVKVHDPERDAELEFTAEAAVVRCDRRPDGQFDLGLFFMSVPDHERKVLDEILERGLLLPAH